MRVSESRVQGGVALHALGLLGNRLADNVTLDLRRALVCENEEEEKSISE